MGWIHGSLKSTMEEFQRIRNSGSENQPQQNDEKGDKPHPFAMFIALLIVVLPVIVIAAGVLLLVFWLFTG